MILIDLNQVCIANILQEIKQLKKIEPLLVKHMILSTLLFYRRKFRDQYGDLVICCDSKKSWRRDIFPFYKANRKSTRAKDDIDWNGIFEVINSITQDLKSKFPYAVISVDQAEADDIIGVLSKNYYRNEKIMIVSSDKDFLQLQKYYSVEQYSPTQKKLLQSSSPYQYLKEHIMKGDRGDGIPNFLSDDDTYVTDKRSKKILKTKLEAWKNLDPTEFCNEKMMRGWKRNQQLVDLSHTPQDIKQKIVDQYDTYEYNQRDKLLNYFIQNKLRNLIEHIGDF
jgi:5'-3' exonuclease